MDGWITIGTKLDTKSFDAQIDKLEKDLEQLEKDYATGKMNGLKEDNKVMKEIAVNIEQTRNRLTKLRQEQAKLNKTPAFDNLGKSLKNSIKDISRLVLGIFGVRSAFLAMRRAASDLATYDPQFGANLEYIRFVLTQSIAPVLKWIVSLAGTLLSYIYAILNAWFGIGSKLNVSAEAFNKMKRSAGGVSKAVKEIKRELLGFDEITRLTDQSDTGTSAGAGGVGMPDFDVGQVGELPKWVKWIMDNKNIVLGVLGAIAGVIAGIKIVNFFSALRGIFGVLEGMSALQIFGMIAGFAITIQGIVDTVKALIKYIKNPSWKNFRDVLKGIQKVLIGVGIAMVAFNATNPVGWILLAVGAIIKLVEWLTKDEAHILSTKDAQEQLNQAIKNTKQATDEYINAVDNAEASEKALIEAEKKHKISGKELYDAVQNGTLNYKDMNEAQREVYKAYLNNKNAQDELLQSTSNLTTAKKEEKDASIENKLAIAEETGNYDDLKKSVLDMFNKGEISAEEARDIFERAMGGMSKSSRKTFMEDLPDNIKNGLDPNKYGSTWSNFQRKWNNFIDGLKMNLKLSVGIGTGGGFSGGRGYGGGSGSGGGRAKGGIFYPSQLPKLAVGGIINMPGRGVPYNGAVIGERGAEAVVPLTDTQQMELLGATIGKYITVNANIVNTMNGRIISRELKQVQSEQDFAYNT